MCLEDALLQTISTRKKRGKNPSFDCLHFLPQFFVAQRGPEIEIRAPLNRVPVCDLLRSIFDVGAGIHFCPFHSFLSSLFALSADVAAELA